MTVNKKFQGDRGVWRRGPSCQGNVRSKRWEEEKPPTGETGKEEDQRRQEPGECSFLEWSAALDTVERKKQACLLVGLGGCWSLLMRVKKENERASLKLNIKKTKIMVSGPITSWQIEGERGKVVTDFLFLGSKNPCGWCSHETRGNCFLAGKLWQT